MWLYFSGTAECDCTLVWLLNATFSLVMAEVDYILVLTAECDYILVMTAEYDCILAMTAEYDYILVVIAEYDCFRTGCSWGGWQ